MSLEALRVKNLRSLTDTGRIPLRPITILVGRNSSGKSTFLRAFPLLRQSVETSRNSPVLWNREHYVDFGSLRHAISDKASERSMTFDFSVELLAFPVLTVSDRTMDVAMTLAEGAPPQGPYVQRYEIRCSGHQASLRFDPLGKLLSFTVNGADVAPTGAEMSLGGAAYLLSTLRSGSQGKVTYQPVIQPLNTVAIQYRTSEFKPLLYALVRELRAIFQPRTADDILTETAVGLYVGTADDMWQALLDAVNGRRVKAELETQGKSGPLFTAIMNRTVARMTPWILDAADQYIADFMSRVAYLAPLRATADRAYRVQDLAVNDVDPDGKNLAMFMRSLSEPEMASFAAFTREHLGFESKISVSDIHAEILVKEPGASRHINLVDIGFGYTEVLPLMAILWSTCCREPAIGSRPASLLAIEQPELHLHPAHQAKLAGVIAAAWRASRDARREVKIMVETHSEGIVNRMGELIAEGVVQASDVQIVFFDQDPETRQTEVRLTGYTEEGALKDTWPFGFFAPVVD